MKLYWGDLHSHCSISYGQGSLKQALLRASKQLDFCSITGHAFWPDMPSDRARYGAIIDYHRKGFDTLAENWPTLVRQTREACVPASFLALPSYEWHSLKYGDHNVYGPTDSLPLLDAPDLPELRREISAFRGIAIPHHIGYTAGYRGIDWDHFQEDQSPFVEVFSLHGCSESEEAPHPMLHDMGPRHIDSTAEEGWRRGHRFGIVGSTDHHGAYPGSHGDGRLAVLAEGLSRKQLWEAWLKRRVYAATGDRIEIGMELGDGTFGDVVHVPGTRRLHMKVQGWDRMDRVELIKNGRRIRCWIPEENPQAVPETGPWRLRLTWGWGRKDTPVSWDTRLDLEGAEILRADSCFSGQSVVAPKGTGGHGVDEDQEDLPHEILSRSPQHCHWKSVTLGNPTMKHPSTQALSLLIQGPLDARLKLKVNGVSLEGRLGDYLRGGQVHHLRGWLTEAIRIGPLTGPDQTTLEVEHQDEPELEFDHYRLRAFQYNGQAAWVTPIWVES